MRKEMEDENARQRTEIKAQEKKTKEMNLQVDELRTKLKDKETMLRIAKFKLAEVNRNIK